MIDVENRVNLTWVLDTIVDGRSLDGDEGRRRKLRKTGRGRGYVAFGGRALVRMQSRDQMVRARRPLGCTARLGLDRRVSGVDSANQRAALECARTGTWITLRSAPQYLTTSCAHQQHASLSSCLPTIHHPPSTTTRPSAQSPSATTATLPFSPPSITNHTFKMTGGKSGGKASGSKGAQSYVISSSRLNSLALGAFPPHFDLHLSASSICFEHYHGVSSSARVSFEICR